MLSQLPLPPQSLRFMAEDDEKFLRIAAENASLLQSHGLQQNHSLLDLGCGYGRLAYGLERNIQFQGKYVGFDILKRHVDWCKSNIQSERDNYNFEHLDIQNDRYNPKGKLEAQSWKFEYDSERFDYACLFSVFTHMYEDEIKNYLSEIHRVLKSGGRCFATFFLFDEERLARIAKPDTTLCMVHVLNEHTRYHNAADKLHAICFERRFVQQLVETQGFRLVELNYGSWGGGHGSYQDYVVLEKV